MDSTFGQHSSTMLPSHRSLPYSLLPRKMDLGRNRCSDWQQDGAQQRPWSKLSPEVGSYSGLQRSRHRSAPFAFKRQLENRDHREPSSKHFLSEDKMAARFNSLSLDNDHIYSSNGFPVHNEDPTWQEAYTRLKKLQQRLSQDGETEEIGSIDENESNIIVDGEFLMADCPKLKHPFLLQEGFGRVNVTPEELFLSLNPCTEVVLWSPQDSVSLRTIRTLMALPSSMSSSLQPQQEVAVGQEEMEA